MQAIVVVVAVLLKRAFSVRKYAMESLTLEYVALKSKSC